MKSFHPKDLRSRNFFLAFFRDRKSTRLNSSHDQISYAVFCLKKKKKNPDTIHARTPATTVVHDKVPLPGHAASCCQKINSVDLCEQSLEHQYTTMEWDCTLYY